MSTETEPCDECPFRRGQSLPPEWQNVWYWCPDSPGELCFRHFDVRGWERSPRLRIELKGDQDELGQVRLYIGTSDELLSVPDAEWLKDALERALAAAYAYRDKYQLGDGTLADL